MKKYCLDCMREFSTKDSICPKCGGELIKIKDYNMVSFEDLLKEINKIPSNFKTETLSKFKGRCVRCGKKTNQVSYIKFLLEGGREKINNLETICDDCLKRKHDVRKAYHNLNSLDDDLLNLIFFKTNVPEIYHTREEKVIYLSENVDDVNSLIVDMEYRLSFDEKFSDLGSDFEEIATSFNIPKELTNFKDKIYYLILHASVNDLESILGHGPYLNKFIEYLESLEDKVFNLLCEIFSLDLSNSRNENIENLVSGHSTDEIELEIVFIELKFELFDQLLNLDVETFKNFLFYLKESGFNHLMDVSSVSREDILNDIFMYYKNSADYDDLIKFNDFIKKAHRKTYRDLFFNKINGLGEKAFYYLSYILSIPPLESKEEKINYILENIDPATIDFAINDACHKVNINKMLHILHPIAFELASKTLTIDSKLSFNQQCDYLVLNYDKGFIDNFIKLANENFNTFSKLSGYDERKLKYLYHIFNAEGESDEERIKFIVVNKIKDDVDKGIRKTNAKIKQADDLKTLDSDIFELLSAYYDLDSNLSVEDRADYLILNYDKREINKSIKLVQEKISISRKLYEYDDRRLKYLYHICDAKGDTKEDKINFILDNDYNFIIEKMGEIEYKLDFAVSLQILDDFVLNGVCKSFLVPDGLSVEDKCDILVLNFSKLEIDEHIKIVNDKFTYYLQFCEYDDRRLKYLYHICDAKGDTKEDKINFILDNYFNNIISKISEIESSIKYAKMLEVLEGYVLNRVCKSFSVPDGLSVEDKCDILVLNFDKKKIYEEVEVAQEKYEIYQRIYNLNEKIFEYLLYILSVEELDSKSDQIDEILDKNISIKIMNAINDAEEKFEYYNNIKSLELGIFELLCKHFSISEKLLFEEKIDYLVLNNSVELLDEEIEKSKYYFNLIESLNKLDDRGFKYLCNILKINNSYSKDVKIEKIITFDRKTLNDTLSVVHLKVNYINTLESLEDDVFDVLCNNLSVSGSKDQKIDNLIMKYEIVYLKSEVIKAEKRVSLFNKLDNLDNRLFKYLEHKLSVSDLDSKEDKINHILNNNIKEIPNLMDQITEDLRYAKELENLNDYVLNYLSEIFNVPEGISKVEKCDYLVLHYYRFEISSNIRKAQNRYVEFFKLKDLDDKLFDYLSYLLLSDSGEISKFNELSQDKQIDYILDNYTTTQINNITTDSKEKLRFYETFSALKKNTFTQLALNLGVPDTCSTKEEKLDYLVLNNQNHSLTDELNYIRERIEVFETLNLLNEKTFSYLVMELNINEEDIKIDSSYNLNKKEEMIHYILLNKKGHIFEALSKAEVKSKIYNKIDSLERHAYILFLLYIKPNEEKVWKDIKDKQIDYFVLNYSKSEIDSIIEKLNTRMNKFNELIDLEDKSFEFAYDYLKLKDLKTVKVEDLSLKEKKIYNSILNRTDSELDEAIDFALKKSNTFYAIDNLKDIGFVLLSKNLFIFEDLSFKKLDKVGKIGFIMDKFSLSKLDNELEIVNEKLRYSNKLNSLNNLIFNILCMNFNVPDEGYAIDNKSNLKNSTVDGFRENKINYLILNHSIPEMDDEISIIEKIEKIFIKLDFNENRINSYFKDYLNILSKDGLGWDKESKIKSLFKSNSNDEINKSIEPINNKLYFFDKLDYLTDSVFKLLALDFNLNDSYSREEKIDYLVNNFDEEEVNKEIDFIKTNINFFNEILEFEDKKISLLFNDLAIPETINSNEEKVLYIFKNNSIDKIQECIDLVGNKLDIYSKINILNNLFLELFCNSFDINLDSKNSANKEEVIYSIILKYSFLRVKTTHQLVLDKIELSNILFDKIFSLSDKFLEQFFNEFVFDEKRIFPLIDFKTGSLSDIQIKEKKIFYIIFNNDESKINEVYDMISNKEKAYIKLNNLNNWSFNHACSTLNIVQKDSKEETIDDIIENRSEAMINDVFNQIETRKITYYNLKSIDEKVFVALTKSTNIPPEYSIKGSKINYLLYNFSADMIDNKVISLQKDVEKISDKLSENEELANYIFNSFGIDNNLEFEDKLIQLFGSVSIENINSKILRRNVGNRLERGFKRIKGWF